jgi:RimJ/RimL family protein N-acetyltransferase
MIDLDYTNYFWSGKRIRLRGLTEADAESAFANTLDSPGRQVLQLGIELPTSVAALRDELEKRANCRDVGGVILFAIETHDGTNVGGVSLHTPSLKNGTFSFGVNIHRKHRGNGYAEEAVRILLRYGFHERRFQKCNSACVEINDASIALHRKLGFVEEGRRRRHLFLNGRFYDDILFGLTREEFDASIDERG